MLVLAALPVLAQEAVQPGFQTVQRQVETTRTGMIKSTVAVRVPGGSGSGVIITPDGLVLTAAHVVAGPPGRRLAVTLADGRTLPAEVLGSDRGTDLGLMQIGGANGLPTASLGDSSVLRRRQWVLATGHPLGVNSGRPPVLRIGRVLSLPQPGATSGSVITDAPIISGDSGGPLFDLQGRVVGINSMITVPGRRMVSIHVPVNFAKLAIELARHGDAPEAWGPSAALSAAVADAEKALLSGNAALAVTRAKDAAALDATSARARVVLARALARSNDRERATAALKEACDLGFADPGLVRGDPDLVGLSRDARIESELKRLDALDAIVGQRKTDVLRASTPPISATDPQRSIVRLLSGGREVALATVMTAEGDLLTKASELPAEPLEAILPNGTHVPVVRGRIDSTWDVALLKIKATGLVPAALAGEPVVGQWTFSAGSVSGTPQLGIVGVATMPVLGEGIAPKPTSKAYMGVQLGAIEPRTLRGLGVPYGVAAVVQPDYPAARAGVRTGDVIVMVEGFPARDPDAVMDALVSKQPGERVRIQLLREGQKLTVMVQLATRPAELPGRGSMPAMLSGEVSRMQGPFPSVLHHDAMLPPAAMGGPVLDLAGQCIGLNIARADRTSTYAIPARELREIYARLTARPAR